MTTSQSPLRVLKAQADKIAMTIKAAERGEKLDVRFAEKIEAARRDKSSVKVGVVMDDKTLLITLPWKQIEESSEVGLAEFILGYMRGQRETSH